MPRKRHGEGRRHVKMKLLKTRRAIVAGLAAVMLSGTLLTGCAGTAASTQSGSAATAEQAGSAEATSSKTRTVTDSEGNKVEIPYNVTKVAPTIGAFAQVTEMLTNGNGKIVAAATKQVDDNFKSVFKDYEKTNPDNNDSTSVEGIIASGAQVAYGPKSAFSDEQLQQLKDAGVTFVDVSKMKTPDEICDSIQLIGDILGKDESARAKEFVKYYKKQIKTAQDYAAKHNGEKATMISLSVEGGQYFVAPASDIANQYIEAAGLTNPAADYTSDTKSTNGSMVAVSAEQIAQWNPDFILCFNMNTKNAVIADKAFSKSKFMQDGGSSNYDNVLVCPKGLYLWSVRSAEGCLLPEFLGSYAYAATYGDFSMEDTLKDFYKQWYNKDLSSHDAELILTGRTNQTVAGSKK